MTGSGDPFPRVPRPRGGPLRGLASLALAALLLVGCGGKDAPSSGTTSEAPEAVDLQTDMANAAFALSQEMREYIWDAEHLALVVGQDLLPLVRAAIQGKQQDAFARTLAPDLEARVFAGEGTRRTHGLLAHERWTADHARKQLDRSAFVAWLADLGKRFREVKRVGFHLTRLRPEEHGNLGGRWLGRFDVHVMGVLPDGTRGEHMLLCELGFRKLHPEILDEAGWIDRFVTARGWFVRSVGVSGPLLVDATAESGIDVSKLADNWKRTEPPFLGVTGGLHAIDGNDDGRVDLLVNDTEGFFYFEQTAFGRFEDATERVGLVFAKGESVRSVIPGDFDGDGREDLMLLVLGRTGQGEVRLYRNRPDGRFARAGVGATGLEGQTFEEFDGVVADYDGDGKLDVYVIKQGAAAPKSMQEARWIGDATSREGLLLRNRGGWRFEDATVLARMTGKSVDTYGAVWFDLEGDGDADLFLSNHMGPNVLWRNEGDGTFVSVSTGEGFGGFSMGVSAGDLDEDGDSDLYVANMYSSAGMRVMEHLRAEDYPDGWFPYIEGFVLGNELYKSGPDGLTPVGIQAEVDVGGWAYGPALMDLDGDGRLDIYSPAGFQSVTRGKPDG